MSERKDYYKILEVTDEERKLTGDAFKNAIKPHYRKISLKYHPDKNPGNKEAEEKFKEATEAWSVLSDPQKRAEYDNPMSNFSFTGNMDMEDIIRHFNMDFDDFGPFESGWGNRVMKGSDIDGTLNLTLEDIYNGVDKKIRIKRKKVCHTCNGTGKDSNSKEELCRYCNGTGFITQRNGFVLMRSTCPHCGGVGKFVVNPCHTCGGSGLEDEVIEKVISIPKGIQKNTRLKFNSLGNEIPGENSIPGDLNIFINELPHKTFNREGNDLVTIINVSVIDAILGCKMPINTINNKKVEVTIPRGSEEGKHIIINGYGLPIYNSNMFGSLICVIHIVMPKNITNKEVKKLEELRKSESFKKLSGNG